MLDASLTLTLKARSPHSPPLSSLQTGKLGNETRCTPMARLKTCFHAPTLQGLRQLQEEVSSPASCADAEQEQLPAPEGPPAAMARERPPPGSISILVPKVPAGVPQARSTHQGSLPGECAPRSGPYPRTVSNRIWTCVA